MTAIICTISPASVNYYQTLSTLRFATRAKIVKTKPKINEYLDDKGAIEFYKNEVRKLQQQLKSTGGSNKDLSEVQSPAIQEKLLLEQIMKTNESLSNELENYKGLYYTEKEKNKNIQNTHKNNGGQREQALNILSYDDYKDPKEGRNFPKNLYKEDTKSENKNDLSNIIQNLSVNKDPLKHERSNTIWSQASLKIIDEFK